jgi:tetratricopeptide (TPR) repeat protein
MDEVNFFHIKFSKSLLKKLIVLFLLVILPASQAMAVQQSTQPTPSGIDFFSAPDKLLKNNKYADALNGYEGIPVSSLSTEGKAHLKYEMGECYYNLGNKTEAIESYREAYLLGGSDQVKAGHHLVRILTFDGQYEEAFANQGRFITIILMIL